MYRYSNKLCRGKRPIELKEGGENVEKTPDENRNIPLPRLSEPEPAYRQHEESKTLELGNFSSNDKKITVNVNNIDIESSDEESSEDEESEPKTLQNTIKDILWWKVPIRIQLFFFLMEAICILKGF